MEKINRAIWKAEMYIRGRFISLPLLGFAGLFSVLRMEKLACRIGKIGVAFGIDAAAIKVCKLSRTDEEREKAEKIYNNLVEHLNEIDALMQ